MVARGSSRLIAAALLLGTLFSVGASAKEKGDALAQQEHLGKFLSALYQLEHAKSFSLSLSDSDSDVLHGKILLRGMVAHLREEAMSSKRSREKADSIAMQIPTDRASGDGLFGILSQPVRGILLNGFGEPDGSGGIIRGLVIEAEPSARIVMPIDGEIVFSAPFQNYGQLLIIEVGEGYHLVMAGLERSFAVVGEWLARGDPVGVMGMSRVATFAGVVGSSSPQLYLEFRRRGEAVAPRIWVKERGKWKNG